MASVVDPGVDRSVSPWRRLAVGAPLAAAALAGAFLTVGVAHSVMVLTGGRLSDDQLTILRGRWELVAASAALFLVFLGLIPVRLRRDWRASGLYAAFVISLFAEMFGFPLTVYFLSSALGLPVFERRFMVYMYRVGMPVGSLVTVLGMLLVVLGWRAIYRAKDVLVTGGIYRYIRHPQYLGILLVTAGWLIHWPTLPGLLMWPVLVLLYVRQAHREEAELARRFGEAYQAYARRTPGWFPRPGRRLAATLVLAAATGLAMLFLVARGRVPPETPRAGGRTFYVVPYHYGFAFYDQDLAEVAALQVRTGEQVTLHIVPALALGREAFLAYARRTVQRGFAGLAPGDPRILGQILEDVSLGNVEHVVGIAAHPVYVATRVAEALRRRSPQASAPATLRDAVRQRDPAIVTVTFTAGRTGRFDVICLDADPLAGTGTCGWGHKWMVAPGAFVVTP